MFILNHAGYLSDMPELHIKFIAETRSLVDRSKCYAGQQCDSGSTTLIFHYDPLNFIEQEGVTPYIIFDVNDDEGNPLTYGPNSTPKFDGYRFDVPWDVTSRAKRYRVEYQLWFVKNNVTIDDETQIPHLDSSDYILSAVGGIALGNSIVGRNRCDPGCPTLPTTEPKLMGLMDIVLKHAVMLPVKMALNDETERLELTFNTYYGEVSQTLSLNVPYLDENDEVPAEFLPIIQSWFDSEGRFIATAQNIASSSLVYQSLEGKTDKVMAIPSWDSTFSYSVGAAVIGSDGAIYRATAPSMGVDPTSASGSWTRVLDLTSIVSGSLDSPSDSTVPSTSLLSDLLGTKLDKASVVDEWSEVPSSTSVPSERLVYSEMAGKAPADVVTDEWLDPHSSTRTPSERLVYEALDAKADKSNAIPVWDSETVYGYQAVVIFEGALYISSINGNVNHVPTLDTMYWSAVSSGSGGSGTVARGVFAQVIGNGEDTEYVVKHDLHTRNITAELRMADERAYVRSRISVVDDDTIRVTFTHAPSQDSIVVMVASYIASPNAVITTLGNGIDTSFEVEHSFGTYNVFAQLRDADTGLLVYSDITAISPSAVRVDFARPPDADSIVLCLAPCIPDSTTGGFTYTQSTPSAEWTINHGLNRVVAVYTTSLDGEEMSAWVKQDMTTLSSVTIRFSEPVSGIAYLR